MLKLGHILPIWYDMLLKVQHINKLGNIQKAHRTNSTFGFCRHESQRRKNQKSCFLPTLGRNNEQKQLN